MLLQAGSPAPNNAFDFFKLISLISGILFGSVAGAFVNEWIRRRRSRVHSMALIERVNRPISTEFRGLTLARIVGDPAHRRLEEVKNVREYQLTLRNTSGTHLKNAAIKFEFLAKDVEAWASRPALSKTALVETEATPVGRYNSAFAWKVPSLPAGDSVEFSFQAVDPPPTKDPNEKEYEASLYEAEGIILEKIVGEPAPSKAFGTLAQYAVPLLTIAAAAITAIWIAKSPSGFSKRSMQTPVDAGGCTLLIQSTSSSADMSYPPPSKAKGPWEVYYYIFNFGHSSCQVQSSEMGIDKTIDISPNSSLLKTKVYPDEPVARNFNMTVSGPNSQQNVTVSAYAGKLN